MIRQYLKLFLFVTKHGIYIDGFAAPQKDGHPDKWTAKLVLDMQPKWFNEYWLCDLQDRVAPLEALRDIHHTDKQPVFVLGGDFNASVHQLLAAGSITEKKATFALLDQRTFECSWTTVQALANHKKLNKIELFYFLATGWLDRSLNAVTLPAKVDQVRGWWGRDDVGLIRGMEGEARAKMVAARFRDELGYRFATAYPIYKSPRGGRVMYHMIHATDHSEAPKLMGRAYRKVARVTAPQDQTDLEDFIKSLPL